MAEDNISAENERLDTSRLRPEWPEQNRLSMAVLVALNAGYVLFGAYVMWRCGRKWIPLWLGALLAWATVCKYFICTRCERYGEACDYCYGGKYAAMLFSRQPDMGLDAGGIMSEGISTSIMMWLPVVVARNKRLIRVCCIRCTRHARDPWKARWCPNYKLASMLSERRRSG